MNFRPVWIFAVSAFAPLSACGSASSADADPTDPSSVAGSGGTAPSTGGASNAGSPGGAAGSVATAGGTPQGGAPQGGASQGGASQGGASQGGASQGGASQGGTAGSGGTPPSGGAGTAGAGTAGGSNGGAPPLNCNGAPPPVSDEVIGWAAVSGDGVAKTTGGQGGKVVRVKTAAELKSLAASADAAVLEIEGTLDVGTLDVVSNKTLIGVGKNAKLTGGVRVRPLKSSDPLVSNVVMRNLSIDATTSNPNDGGDGIHIERAHHVWVDHCDVWNASDGNTDVTHGSNWITVSWTKYHYTASAPKNDHRFSNLIGHSENAADTDRGRLKVTYHHTWWSEGVEQRMPRVRFGDVHVFNNYINAPGAVAAVAAGTEAKLLVENNHFQGVNDPHFFHEGSTTAQIAANGNAYFNVTGKRDVGQGAAFTPPYAYQLDPVEGIPCAVTRGAGPR